MKIKFSQTGGIAGLVQECEIDTEKLPRAEAAAIEKLVRIAGTLKSYVILQPTAHDIFGYTISVKSSEITYHISFDDLTIPEGGGPLLAYLKKRVRRQRT